jgi:6-phosphogluconolactonase
MFMTNRVVRILTLAVFALPVVSQGQANRDAGAVFVMTNGADKNEIIAYQRHSDGSLTERNSFPTGGRGSGGVNDPLGSQGSLTLTRDHSFLLAVNAGSGNISVFRVEGDQLWLVDKVRCGGAEPVAVAQQGNLVYVVNAGGTSNVTGFQLDWSGKLHPIANSTAFLTTANSGAAALSFSPDGKLLLVTEKLTNNVDAFRVQNDGTLSPIVVNPSAGPGLFGVLFAPNGIALTTQTGPTGANDASALSSYAVHSDGTLSAISANVPTLANATCWNVVTPDGRFVYTSNPGSGTISGFALAANGELTAIGETILATLPTGSSNLDIAITPDGKFIYTLDSGTGKVSAWAINADGTLTVLPEIGGLVANSGFNGIAAF